MMHPMLAAAVVLAAGVAGGAAARRVKLPAVAGALGAGAIAALLLPGAGAGLLPPPPIASWLTAFLGFTLGASLDPSTFLRNGRGVAIQASLSLALVAALAGGAAALLGLPWQGALMLGVATAAAAPFVPVAVAAEARARGPATQRWLAQPPLTLIAAIAASLLLAHDAALLRPLASLAAGALCGAILLVPLSRLSRRAGITAAIVLALPLLERTAALARGGEAGLVLASILAGFVAVNFIPGRLLVREALRDLAVPASIAWGAWSAAALAVSLPASAILAALPAAALLTAARAAGLWIAAGGRSASSPLVMLPAAPLLVLAPLIPIAAPPAGAPVAGLVATIAPIAVVLTLLSALAGAPLAARALARSGETAGDADDPDAWRGGMR